MTVVLSGFLLAFSSSYPSANSFFFITFLFSFANFADLFLSSCLPFLKPITFLCLLYFSLSSFFSSFSRFLSFYPLNPIFISLSFLLFHSLSLFSISFRLFLSLVFRCTCFHALFTLALIFLFIQTRSSSSPSLSLSLLLSHSHGL